jgi:hypothetical protein
MLRPTAEDTLIVTPNVQGCKSLNFKTLNSFQIIRSNLHDGITTPQANPLYRSSKSLSGVKSSGTLQRFRDSGFKDPQPGFPCAIHEPCKESGANTQVLKLWRYDVDEQSTHELVLPPGNTTRRPASAMPDQALGKMAIAQIKKVG